ncbi:MAG: tRNA (adenosine(37)-N6)-threonylcarbamoyltransferase complex dimerization subunit type 1 TsaB, partial [Verrucomicrobiales bacterium]
MLTLALETSTPQGSLALFEGDSLVEERTFQAVRGHNSKIFASLRDLLELLEGKNLTRVVVGTGPGSYAGVRISISIADALALSHDAALIGCSSLIAAEGVSETERCWLVGDARRHTWYRAEIQDGKLSGPIIVEDREAWERAVCQALEEG